MSQPIISSLYFNHIFFILQEEQLRSSERELSKNREPVTDAQKQMRQKVSRHCESFYVIIPINAGSRA